MKPDINNSVDGVNNRTRMIEERVNELKKEIRPSEQERANRNWTESQRLLEKAKDLTFMSSESQKEKGKRSTENVFEGKMAENFLNLAKDINLQM